MKRVVLPLALVCVLAAAGLYLFRRFGSPPGDPAAWLPADTILYQQMPDLYRTSQRWPDTDLAHVIAEPEVQTFLQKPIALFPYRAQVQEAADDLRRILPRQSFLAVTNWSGPLPVAVAGFSFTGRKSEVDAVIDKLRQHALAIWPEGHSDIVQYGAGDLETFTTPAFTAALAYRGRWLFFSTDVTALKATLDRYDGHGAPDTLAASPDFQEGLRRIPGSPDSIIFIHPGVLADKASSLALMINPAADVHQGDDLKKIHYIAMGLKMQGSIMRDAAYISEPVPGAHTPLARDVLKISTPDTILAIAGRVKPMAAGASLPDPKSDPTGVLQLLDSDLQIFAAQGLGAAQFDKAFGPESGFVLDWPNGSMIPTVLVMLDVRDPALARKFLDTLSTIPLAAGVDFTHADSDGIAWYSLPPSGFGIIPLQPAFGLTPHALIGALNPDPVKAAFARWDSHTGGLQATEPYGKAADLVDPPTESFTYLDMKSGFERVYGLFRGVASIGFIPHLAEYVDITKLPQPQTISAHLAPAVASTSIDQNGILMQSAGPVTVSQAGFVTLVAAGVAAVPYVEAQFQGQNGAIPGFQMPGLSGTATLQDSIKSLTHPAPSVVPFPPAPSTAPPVPAPAASASRTTP
jgi:hypothetical protein